MTGTTGMPGNCSATSCSIGPMIEAVSGDGGLGVGVLVARSVMRSSGARRRRVASTSEAGSPGRMRQLTVSRADWGSAFSAWPAAIMVATQVVRSLEL